MHVKSSYWALLLIAALGFNSTGLGDDAGGDGGGNSSDGADGGGQCLPMGRGGPRGGGSDAGSLGLLKIDPLFGLVDPGSGSVLEAYADLSIASKGSAAVQWSHYRTYDSRSTNDTVQGYGWFHHYLQNLTLVTPGDPPNSDVTWRADAHHQFTFTKAGSSYTFNAHDSTLATLSHEHAGDPADTYRLTFLDGTLMIFYDFEYATTAVRGKLYYIEDAYGNKLTVTHTSGTIDYVTDPFGHYFRYSYLSSGANSGKLDYIRVFKSSGTTDADLMARIEFTYYLSGQGYDSSCGTTGDLIKVLVKTHKTGETGTTFSLTSTQHYRYDGSHNLEMILRPEHYQRADDNLANDPLAETDANIDDYATYQFTYSSDRCATMVTAIAGSG